MFDKKTGKKGLYIYMKPGDYDNLKKIAEEEGLALSSWARQILLKILRRENDKGGFSD